MRIVIKGKNMDVPEQLRDYIQKKLGKLDRYLDNVSSATVELSHEKTKSAVDRYVAQATFVASGTILRGEEKAFDVRAAIDAVADVMQRQAVRYKEKLYSRGRVPSSKGAAIEAEATAWPEKRIVKTKQFPSKPMTLDEAVDQMELLGHDFFVFHNSETGQVNVLYIREDGDYGLMEPEAA
ncbi:MAG: ribosome-associated translation inhibitor RaiA [Chloroflexi bacterium]|nr:ribosome-associated translation inhibitor RaiA [Chloroflexota bacterium]